MQQSGDPHEKLETFSNALIRPCLYVIATPLGNLSDLSPRALRILESCDFAFCEDTRNYRHLAAALKISLPQRGLIAYHEHVERQRSDALIERLLREEACAALVSDAGTPSISDPGYRIVKAAHEAGLRVCPVPGPSAVTTLVSASGLPCERFQFIGFLPKKEQALREEIESWRKIDAPIVFMESPRRLVESLTMAALIYPQAKVALGRELTKFHEEIRSGDIHVLLELLRSRPDLKGECIVMLDRDAASETEKFSPEILLPIIRERLKGGDSTRDLVDWLIKNFKGIDLNRRTLYDLCLKEKSEADQ